MTEQDTNKFQTMDVVSLLNEKNEESLDVGEDTNQVGNIFWEPHETRKL